MRILVPVASWGSTPLVGVLAAGLCLGCRLPAQPIAIPDEYADAYDGVSRYEVVAGVELAMILTAVALRDADVALHPIRRDTDYYDEVIEHFAPHAGHPVFEAVGLVADPDAERFEGGPYRSYKSLRNSGYRWRLADEGLEKYEFIGNWWLGEQYADPFSENIGVIRDFVQKSRFGHFFEEHRSLYRRLAELYEERVDLEGIVDWLSANFSSRYSSYRVLFSPLLRGNQTTTRKRDDDSDFKQVFMIVDPPDATSTKTSTLYAFRWVFTELDHQYVDPAADAYRERIDQVFGDRDPWTAGRQSQHYGTPFRVFTEYLTWSLYVVYLRERHPPEDHERVAEAVTEWIENRRGFSRYGAFTAELVRLRQETGRRVEDLLPLLLDWAETQSRR